MKTELQVALIRNAVVKIKVTQALHQCLSCLNDVITAEVDSESRNSLRGSSVCFYKISEI
jgi:RNA-binding protein YhbY